jgi:hypothetical protein
MNTNKIATETGIEQLTLCAAPKLSRKAKDSGCKGTIATIAIEALKSGKTAEQALTAVLEAKPDAKTSIKCIYWYASKQKIDLRNRKAPEAQQVTLETMFSDPEATAKMFAAAETVTKVIAEVKSKKVPRLIKKAS